MTADELAGKLRQHVFTLASEIGERHVGRRDALYAAERYIAGVWTEQGYEVRRQTYTAQGVPSSNLEVEMPAPRPDAQIVVVGAHYDSVPGTPGADDNASGVAALLELARLLRGIRPAQKLRLVAFVNEEPPFFYFGEMGSGVYAKAARARGDPIRLMISLEMLGYYDVRPRSQRYPPLLGHFYPDRGDFIAFVANLRSHAVLREAVGAFKASSDFPVEWLASPAFVPGVSWSDQLSFWREGYRALMITDTAFHRNPNYHQASDTAATLDYGRMARVVLGLAGCARALVTDFPA